MAVDVHGQLENFEAPLRARDGPPQQARKCLDLRRRVRTGAGRVNSNNRQGGGYSRFPVVHARIDSTPLLR